MKKNKQTVYIVTSGVFGIDSVWSNYDKAEERQSIVRKSILEHQLYALYKDQVVRIINRQVQ